MSNENYRPRAFILPEVVKNLLIINILLFIATWVMNNRGVDLTDVLGLHLFFAEKFRIWQPISHMFMHVGIEHIFFNMLALVMFGSALEIYWGPKRFLTYYILCGLGAAVFQTAVFYWQLQPSVHFVSDYINAPSFEKLESLLNSKAFSTFYSQEMVDHYTAFTVQFNKLLATDMNGAMQLSVEYMKEFQKDVYNAPAGVGASGAIFGLLVAYGMTFPNNVLLLYFVIPVKAKYSVIVFGLLELVLGVANIPGDNIAHFAHLGGAIAGFIILQFWKNKYTRNRGDHFS